jgi:hypothetical protein
VLGLHAFAAIDVELKKPTRRWPSATSLPVRRRLAGCSPDETSLLLISLLILGSAFFSMAELSLAASRRLNLQQRADAGDACRPRAGRAGAPGDYFTVVQIGVNTVAILAGIVGEGAFTPHFERALPWWWRPSGGDAGLRGVLRQHHVAVHRAGRPGAQAAVHERARARGHGTGGPHADAVQAAAAAGLGLQRRHRGPDPPAGPAGQARRDHQPPRHPGATEAGYQAGVVADASSRSSPTCSNWTRAPSRR